jgi:glycosyltransferase involved in cell wall biosynthesis
MGLPPSPDVTEGGPAHREAGPPRVSVIVPFLDPPEAFLREAVAGVLSQTFKAWELLLVNDGSRPESAAVAAELARLDPARIHCLAHPDDRNHGIPASRNLGLSRARGEIIAYLDSDDFWFPGKLAEQVELLDRYPEVSMLFGRSMYWRSWTEGHRRHDHIPDLGVPDRTVLQRGRFVLLAVTSRLSVPCPSSIMVRAETARAIGGFAADVSNYYEDQGFYAKVSMAGNVLACTNVWDRYRLHPGSLIGSARPQTLLRARREYLDWLDRYIDGIDVEAGELRRAIRLERLFTRFPGGPRLLRYARRMAGMAIFPDRGRVSPPGPRAGTPG